MDMWAIGNILVEMQTKKPMFPGDCEIDELFKIFRVLGTPNESVWAGVALLRDYQSIFPRGASSLNGSASVSVRPARAAERRMCFRS